VNTWQGLRVKEVDLKMENFLMAEDYWQLAAGIFDRK
jgi:hypothetical protein